MARFVDRRTSVLMRRLRENTTLESEISKTGDVTVEGHAVGRLEGFRFAADPSAGGSEAKALHAAAQKVLASEIDSRATRLSQAASEQLVLASDGNIRWLGDAVGALAASDEIMRPRVRLLADEQLTGAPREAVQTRLDLWLKTHIDKLLGPLIALAAADDVTGMARGIAFQLVEALGVLERHKVSNEVKSLDQPARATLRNQGVRFGAYHIYMPALLKPAPRALAVQLFALKQGDAESKGLDEILQLAGSGRTSIAVNKEISSSLYRAAGYRVCGERAVRVDILERLADQIRLALSWRENSPGVVPPGAIAGFGFTVSVGMTSLVGSSGEDFASILRSLGYRMERRPKPPAIPVAAAPIPVVSSNGEQAADHVAREIATDISGDVAADISPDLAPEIAAAIPAVSSETATEISVDVASETATGISADVAAETVTEISESAAAGAPVMAEEPQFIEVWRPGRNDARDRPRKRAPRRPDKRRARPGAPSPAVPAEQSPAPAEAAAASAPEPGASAQAAAEIAVTEPPRHERKHRRPRRRQRGERPQPHTGAQSQARTPARDQSRAARDQSRAPDHTRAPARERREKQPDPNSPFAKLAALKAQLEAQSKEGR